MDTEKEDKMELVIPTMDYELAIKSFRDEFLKTGDDMDGCLSLAKIPEIQDWIKQVESFSSEKTCSKDYVRVTQFLYLRKSDNKVVGVIQIRHYLNEFLEKYGGHVGYSVRPSERRKGYATRMLKGILPLAVELGFDKIVVTCLRENQASIKTILNNGGVYQSTVHEPERDVYLNRYSISLK